MDARPLLFFESAQTAFSAAASSIELPSAVFAMVHGLMRAVARGHLEHCSSPHRHCSNTHYGCGMDPPFDVSISRFSARCRWCWRAARWFGGSVFGFRCLLFSVFLSCSVCIQAFCQHGVYFVRSCRCRPSTRFACAREAIPDAPPYHTRPLPLFLLLLTGPLNRDVDLVNFSFEGDQSTEIELTKATNEITLHSRELYIKKVSFKSSGDGMEQDAVGINYHLGEQLSGKSAYTATFLFKNEIPAGTGVLTLTYTGCLNNQMVRWQPLDCEFLSSSSIFEPLLLPLGWILSQWLHCYQRRNTRHGIDSV